MIKKTLDLRVLIPNLITLVAICSGLSAIRFAFEGNFNLAMIAILLAALLDGIDGRVARALKVTSQFGAELDSLADAVNFGVVPALILYIWSFNTLGDFGWLACLLYVIAVILRLARFNVMDIKSPDVFAQAVNDKKMMPKAYFIGVPAPLAAILVLLPIYISLFEQHVYISSMIKNIEALYVILIAACTVSTVKTFSFKAIRFNAKNTLTIMFTIALIAALLFSFTWLGLVILCLCYVCYLMIISLRAFMRYVRLVKLKKRYEG